ncbi:MAG TPA: STAS domain-containing protein [Frankiaceae bacterium]|jgi:anti-anti-sigma factor|nr:STAS domain-containing protein [Frankiaceae bacterium]
MTSWPYADCGRVAEQHQGRAKTTLRVISTPQKAYTLGLAMSRSGASVCLTGEIDAAAAADVAQLMDSLDKVQGEIHVDLSQVTFLDTSGLQPLIDATRRRQTQALSPVRIERASRPVRRLLDVAGVGGNPVLDARAWDRLHVALVAQPLPCWRTATAERPWSSTPQAGGQGHPPIRWPR